MAHKWGYKGTHSAKIGVWGYLSDLQQKKIGWVFHNKKDQTLRDALISGFAKDAKEDPYQYIQKNWAEFVKYSKRNILQVFEEIRWNTNQTTKS